MQVQIIVALASILVEDLSLGNHPLSTFYSFDIFWEIVETPVRTDARIKKEPNYSKNDPKSSNSYFYFKSNVFQNGLKKSKTLENN